MTKNNVTPEIVSETLKTADYYINYYGTVIDIKPTKKILGLFKRGGGFGDGGADRTWYSYYDLYVPNRKDFGKTLVKIGTAEEHGNGYEVECKFTINGVTTKFDGLSADQFFNTIFQRNQ